MLENYKDQVFHNKEEAERKRNKNNNQTTNHSGGKDSLDTQDYEQTAEEHHRNQQGDGEMHTEESDQQYMFTQQYQSTSQQSENKYLGSVGEQ
eukprot:5436719-Heterocapsa_arctica.AAC.1